MNHIEPPLNFTGSKFKLLDQILPHFDYTKDQMVDLFCGGGSVYTNIVDRYNTIIINDIIKELVGIHYWLINDPNKIIKTVKQIVPDKESQEQFNILRKDFNQNKSAEKLWALLLSSTNNMMRFNKKFEYNMSHGKRTWNTGTTKKTDSFIKHISTHKNKFLFKSDHFQNITIDKSSMVYIDPPYSNTTAGYNRYWEKDDDVKLFEYCNDLNANGHSFCVSGILDHDGKECRLLDLLIKKGYNMIELDFNYNMVSRKGDKKTKEIIIKNY